MYTFTRSVPTISLLTRHLPALLVSLVIAELFFRFGSFSLEALAFLATWFLLDAAVARMTQRNKSQSGPRQGGT